MGGCSAPCPLSVRPTAPVRAPLASPGTQPRPPNAPAVARAAPRALRAKGQPWDFAAPVTPATGLRARSRWAARPPRSQHCRMPTCRPSTTLPRTGLRLILRANRSKIKRHAPLGCYRLVGGRPVRAPDKIQAAQHMNRSSRFNRHSTALRSRTADTLHPTFILKRSPFDLIPALAG